MSLVVGIHICPRLNQWFHDLHVSITNRVMQRSLSEIIETVNRIACFQQFFHQRKIPPCCRTMQLLSLKLSGPITAHGILLYYSCHNRSNSSGEISTSRKMLRSVPIFIVLFPCTGTTVRLPPPSIT